MRETFHAFTLHAFLLCCLSFTVLANSSVKQSGWVTLGISAENLTAEAELAGKLYLASVLTDATLESLRPDEYPGKWQQYHGSLNFGLQDRTVWLAFAVHYQGEVDVQWVLEVMNPSIQWLTVTVIEESPASDSSTAVQTFRLGRAYPFAQRIITDNAFAVPVNLRAGQQSWVVLEARSNLGMQLPLRFSPASEFYATRAGANLLQGLYFGLMLMLASISLVLWIALRDFTYGSYTLFTGCVALWVATRQGLAYQFLWPEHPQWNELAYLFFLEAGALCSVLFTRKFLGVSAWAPLLDRLLKWLAVTWTGLIMMIFTLSLSIGFILATILIIPGGILLLATGIVALSRGILVARYYLMAWSLMITGVIILMGTYLGIFPLSMLTENLFQTGSAMEGILLCIGLGTRLNAFWTQRTDRLEVMVRQRTSDLEDAMQQLSKANAELHHLSTTDGLTGLTNRRDLEIRLDTLWHQARREQTCVAMILLDIDHFKRINDDHGHLVGDACLRSLGHMLRYVTGRRGDIVARYGGEELVIVLPDTSLEAARQMAERIRIDVEKMAIEYERGVYCLTISAGVAAMVPDVQSGPDSLFAAADRKLYEAKGSGRNCVAG
jgi:diguanylate cyclase (GGDEF)-like protein